MATQSELFLHDRPKAAGSMFTQAPPASSPVPPSKLVLPSGPAPASETPVPPSSLQSGLVEPGSHVVHVW